ncbi:MAG: hypothetical protein ACI4GV_03790 [Acutalibacteraceae bacterium]
MGNANGAKFLKVTGILMIVFGAIAVITSIVALLGIGALNVMSDAAGVTSLINSTQYNFGMLYVAGFISLISSVLELVAGIMGVINAEKPEKAKTCMVWGIIVAVMCVVGCIFTTIGGNAFPFFSLVTGLVVPVLYIIGAYKNQQNQL